MRYWLANALALAAFLPVSAQEEARLLRFPAIHGDSLVFSYGGNLFTTKVDGGIARRLTSHEGYEMFARFSPDGKWLAFTGQYDGNTEVYLMPSEGGTPRRLTYTATLSRDEVSDRMGPNNIVIGWKNNEEILFRSRMREPNDFIGQLFTVHVQGGLPQQVPLPRGGFASYSPDQKKLAYNRIFREFRTWKRYRGGMADEIWIHDFETKKTEAITDNPAADVFPMWSGNKIYFLSDRDDSKRFNLFSYDLSTKAHKQHTEFKDWDIKYPSLGDNAIVFENAGYIYRFDLASEKAAKVVVQIREDMAASRGGLKDVSGKIKDGDLSPDGKRAVFSARGDLFTVPAKDGPTRNLTASPGVHEREPQWSPDGKWIACISDATGEDEILLIPQDGQGERMQLTREGGPYKYSLRWSPDSKKVLYTDKKMRLFSVDVDSKTSKLIGESKTWEIRDFAWSPDGQWAAYARADGQRMQHIMLYSFEQNKSFEVTDGWHDSRHPEFSSDGKYLFFVSERDFNPTISETEWNHIYSDMQKIYLVTLTRDLPSPFQPKSDEVNAGKDDKKDEKKEEKKDDKEEKKDEKKEAKKEEKKTPVRVDTEGIARRVVALPGAAGSYSGLRSVGSNLFYFRSTRKSGSSSLFVYDLAARKETDLGKVEAYEISADGKKMLVNKGGSWGIIDLPKSTISIEAMSLSGVQVQLDLQKEWRQIFHESWRQMRDFFYDPNMHGTDWQAAKAKYEALLPYVNHRADLTYVIGEMISDLGAGHAYVGGGELPKLPRVTQGLLGAELRFDPKTRTYQIVKILEGNTWDPNVRSPLAELGLKVKEGDYILAVDGKPTNEMTNIFEALVNTANKQVKLKVNSEPAEKGSHEIVVVPISDEHPLYYYQWVQGNIRKVSEATKGQVGYLHVPDMAVSNGLNEFAKHFYPQLRKKGLIIDVRGNGGGNVSPMLIERLRREIVMVDMSRDTQPRPDPFDLLLGPKVCLLNEFSASDGDLFPYRFRHYKLGKLIGKRSWGGVIGIRGSLPFVDGGQLFKPEFASYDLEGKKWIIENHGVDPDIVVDNDPWEEYRGNDQQLARAIEVILEEMRTQSRELPPIPPFPKR